MPPLVVEAHSRNVEAASKDGKIDGSAGLSVSGIADDKSVFNFFVFLTYFHFSERSGCGGDS